MYDPARHHRRSIRLAGFDYTRAGAYFVTIRSHQGSCIFGEEQEGELFLTRWGEILREEWLRGAIVRPYVKLDRYVIMPNHMHGILVIERPVRATRRVAPHPSPESPRPCGPPSGSLGAILGQFKSVTTKRIRAAAHDPSLDVWHRGYYERIIRDTTDWTRVRVYISENPKQWDRDPENPGMRPRRSR